MKKFILQSFIGTAGILSACALAYFYLERISHQSNIWLIAAALLLFCVGIFFLSRAAKTFSPFGAKPSLEPVSSENSLEEKLKRNNEMLNDYAKTNRIRDQMKVMQIAENAKNAA